MVIIYYKDAYCLELQQKNGKICENENNNHGQADETIFINILESEIKEEQILVKKLLK